VPLAVLFFLTFLAGGVVGFFLWGLVSISANSEPKGPVR
jgi:hypothetical protein